MWVPGCRGEGADRGPEGASRSREQACEQGRESREGASSQVTLEVFTQPRPTSYFSLHLAWIHLYASEGAIALEPAGGLERMLRVGMLVVVCFEGAASTHEDAHAGGLIVLGGHGVLSVDGPDAEGVLPVQHVTEAVPVRWIGESARDGRVDRDRRAFPGVGDRVIGGCRAPVEPRSVPTYGRATRPASRARGGPGVRPVPARCDHPAGGPSERACAIRSPGGAVSR